MAIDNCTLGLCRDLLLLLLSTGRVSVYSHRLLVTFSWILIRGFAD